MEGDRTVKCSSSQEHHDLASSHSSASFPFSTWLNSSCCSPHLAETFVSSISPFFLMFCHAHSLHLRVLHLLLSAPVLGKVLLPPVRALLLGPEPSIKPGEAVASAKTPRKSSTLASSSDKSTFRRIGASASLASRSKQ